MIIGEDFILGSDDERAISKALSSNISLTKLVCIIQIAVPF